jgi:hypothetical protein
MYMCKGQVAFPSCEAHIEFFLAFDDNINICGSNEMPQMGCHHNVSLRSPV